MLFLGILIMRIEATYSSGLVTQTSRVRYPWSWACHLWPWACHFSSLHAKRVILCWIPPLIESDATLRWGCDSTADRVGGGRPCGEVAIPPLIESDATLRWGCDSTADRVGGGRPCGEVVIPPLIESERLVVLKTPVCAQIVSEFSLASSILKIIIFTIGDRIIR
jgi:hypothetical protein